MTAACEHKEEKWALIFRVQIQEEQNGRIDEL